MLYKMRLAGVLIFTFMALTIPTKADDETRTLLQECLATQDLTSLNYCYGYIGGIYEMMASNGLSLTQNYSPAKQYSVCVGNNASTTSGALAQVFINWANRHTENWQIHDLDSVVSALSERWPCP